MLTIERQGKTPLEIPREVRAAGAKVVEAYVADGGKAYAEKKAAAEKAQAAKEAKAAEKGGSK